MGVAALDAFLTWSSKDAPRVDTGPFPPRANAARYVDEFDYLKRLVGIDYIGFGTDFTSEREAADPSNLFEMHPEMMYKQSPSIKYVEGFESVSDIGNVRAEMQRRGYTDEEIAKVFGATGCASFARRGIRKVPGYRLTSLSEKAWSKRRPIL
jgi:membrane dipeptidase